jgi:polyhydroxyalkanoate synthesis repressor PhaR
MSVSPSSRSSGGRAKRAAATPTAAQAGSGAAEEAGMRVLKKYPNRRLYDTATSSYITLAQVKELVMQAEPFVVRDAKTGEDLTRSILLQIILEEEAGGSPIFTEAVLRNIIRFYGHAMQGFFGANLENSIQAFADMQQKMMDNAPGMDGWQKAMQEMMRTYTAQSGQVVQQMQEQMQQQLQASMQNWLEAFQPKR